eukprot:TRINITY_DN5819_c0_g1_i2.p2 TRINITY_DN5819_c0_g1~~TRINITY_DN5819_c0_g1_i2.p2  ORF type:complete len:120 (+),score=5.24 TRINITY_DN5819_c0_g1_i2:527-886(+)
MPSSERRRLSVAMPASLVILFLCVEVRSLSLSATIARQLVQSTIRQDPQISLSNGVHLQTRGSRAHLPCDFTGMRQRHCAKSIADTSVMGCHAPLSGAQSGGQSGLQNENDGEHPKSQL